MRYREWRPAYDAIRADFDFDLEADRAARDLLAELTSPFDEQRLRSLLAGKHVAIAGGATGVAADLHLIEEVDTVVAASVSAGALRAAGESVDLMVTDLDKTPAVVRTLADEGTPVAVHAHGDNITLVREQVPTLSRSSVVPTTQVAPSGPVRNYGGFTDGDRAAFIADHFGADRLTFPGWDLDDPSVGPVKRQKLAWAERLLHWLERRRDEQFALLDGRRDDLTLPWIA